jgi:hypothetical protein
LRDVSLDIQDNIKRKCARAAELKAIQLRQSIGSSHETEVNEAVARDCRREVQVISPFGENIVYAFWPDLSGLTVGGELAHVFLREIACARINVEIISARQEAV